jgi:flagellar protein FliO/FliZ
MPWGVALAADPAASPALGSGEVLNVLLGLVLVLVAIVALAWAARHVLRLQPSSAGPLRVIAGLSLGARERVVLLQAGGVQLVVGVTPGRIQTLHVLTEPLDLAPSVAADGSGGGFRAQLSRALGGVEGRGGRGVQ